MPTNPTTIQEEAASISAAWKKAKVKQLSLADFVKDSLQLACGEVAVGKRHIRDNSRVLLATVVGMPYKAPPAAGDRETL